MTCKIFLVKQTMKEIILIFLETTDVFNQFGQSLADLCCIFNIHIINGRLYDDTDGNYTCTANKGLL